MRRIAGALLLVTITCGFGWSQNSGSAPTPQPSRFVGTVTQIQFGSLTLHIDAGTDVTVRLPANITVLRVPPGATDLKSAAKIALSDVKVGDRLLVRGQLSGDQKFVVALTIMLMSKADLTKAQEAERQDWERRGIAGTVTAVNPEKREILISLPAGSGPDRNHEQPITLSVDTIPQRYATGSVKLNEANPSTLGEIKVGDQVRALGTKSEDGSFRAEKLVFGTFHNLNVTVLSVDLQSRSITAKDVGSGETILVRTNENSTFHRLSPDVARTLTKPNLANGNETAQLIDRAPVFELDEVKNGEPLIVLSSQGENPSETTAILVLAGVEPILAARGKGNQQVVIGPWSLGKGGGDDGP